MTPEPPPLPPPSAPGPVSHQYACPSCGAALEFQPGTAGLSCPYCKAKLDINTGSLANPWTTALLQGFQCPGRSG